MRLFANPKIAFAKPIFRNNLIEVLCMLADMHTDKRSEVVVPAGGETGGPRCLAEE